MPGRETTAGLPQIPGDGADGVDGVGGGGVAGKQDVEVGEAGLDEAGVEVSDFGGGGAAAFELAVAGVVAFWRRGMSEGRGFPHRQAEGSCAR